jgi:hypothetical protein
MYKGTHRCIGFCILVLLITGLCTFIFGCNNTLYPGGCVNVYIDKIKIIATDISLRTCTYPCYDINLYFNECNKYSIESVSSIDQANILLLSYPINSTVTAMIPKYGSKNCFFNLPDPTGRSGQTMFNTVSSIFPFIGIFMLTCTGILMLCILGFYCLQPVDNNRISASNLPDLCMGLYIRRQILPQTLPESLPQTLPESLPQTLPQQIHQIQDQTQMANYLSLGRNVANSIDKNFGNAV